MLPRVMVSDFTETDTNSAFKTLCIEEDAILHHCSTDTRVRLFIENNVLIAQKMTDIGWVEVNHKTVKQVFSYVPLKIALDNDEERAKEMDAPVDEIQLFTGFLFMKKVAIILGETPNMMDDIKFTATV
ncbi:MAG: hypothetical protein MJ250_07245 [Alphaproteobacteria bacterium]|nr:hypothetical protein [Alphaproteobacteria bacterium]